MAILTSHGRCVSLCVSSPRPVRLGVHGAEEVKRHRFFKQDQWTWDSINTTVAPVIPELKSDTDTQYFDVIDDEKDKPDSFATPRVSVCVCLSVCPFRMHVDVHELHVYSALFPLLLLTTQFRAWGNAVSAKHFDSTTKAFINCYAVV